MTSASPAIAVRRRRMMGRLLAGLLAGMLSAPAAAPAAPPGPAQVVTLLGDSITAGYGLPARAALPARLEAALAALGRPAQVRAAGVSGDTAADGLARLNASVPPQTRVCVVALGGNDLLQGQDPAALKATLTAIARRLKARGVTVIIAGLTAPPAIGPGYARDFNAAFPAAARAAGVGLYPDLRSGVAGRPDLTQADGVHPNAAGADMIARRLAPVVARALAGAR